MIATNAPIVKSEVGALIKNGCTISSLPREHDIVNLRAKLGFHSTGDRKAEVHMKKD